MEQFDQRDVLRTKLIQYKEKIERFYELDRQIRDIQAIQDTGDQFKGPRAADRAKANALVKEWRELLIELGIVFKL